VTTPNRYNAKKAIVREWDDWIRTQTLEGIASGRDARKFFLELKAGRSPISGRARRTGGRSFTAGC